MEPSALGQSLVTALERIASAYERLADVGESQLIVSREAVNVQKRLAQNAELMEQMLDNQKRQA